MSAVNVLRMLTRYKAWANSITFQTVLALPEHEPLRQRTTRFGNIVHTLNHVYVIDDIFRAHLEGGEHGYTERNTPSSPPLDRLWAQTEALDRWYIDYAGHLTEEAACERLDFTFVDGQRGTMSRQAMILHVVNHGSYHRGFVGDMLYSVPAPFPANDLSVFLQSDAGSRPS